MIKLILKLILAVFIISFIIFYFWASSASLDESDYHRIDRFNTNSTLDPKDTLSIMTYNIGYLSGMINNLPIERSEAFFKENYKVAVALLEHEKPDIVAFQEIDYNANRSFYQDQYMDLAKDLDYPFGAKSINWDMNYVPFPYFPFSMHFGKVISGQAILSRYPILSTKAFKFKKPESNPFYYNQFYIDRLLQITEIDLGQKVTVINVHLEAYKSDAREEQMRVFIDEIKDLFDGRPVIILGDFNSRLDSKKEKTLDLFLDAFPLVEVSLDSTTNYPKSNGTYPTDNPERKIDHIFYTAETIEMIDWKIPVSHVKASDHLPVMMRFKLKD